MISYDCILTKKFEVLLEMSLFYPSFAFKYDYINLAFCRYYEYNKAKFVISKDKRGRA